MNVITGYSQRGKSAIINIIDYCLGSEECNVPIGTIRSYVSRYALNINLGDKFLFVARDNPEGSSNTYMYYEIYTEEHNRSFSFDRWIDGADKFKSNRDDIKKYLGEIAGFKNFAEKDHDKTLSGFDAPASFRDTTAFQFQPQNIIANPTTIFYNTDSFEHLKRLKTLFPLVLGYKSYDIISLEKEIEVLEKEEKEKQKKYDDIRTQYENWQTEIYQYYSTAVSLSLTNADIDISTSGVNLLKAELEKIVSSIQQRDYFKEGSTLRYSEKLEELDASRLMHMRRLDDLKTDLMKIEKFDKARQTYINEVAGEIDIRLKPVDWFIAQEGTNVCPFCESTTNKAIDELLFFKDQQTENRRVLSKTLSFDKEKMQLKNEIADLEKTIKTLEKNIDILIIEDKEYYEKFQDIFEFAGKIAHVIENLERISPSGELKTAIEVLQQTIGEKRRELYKLKQKFDKELCLKKVTDAISEYIKILPIEDRTHQKVRLDPDISVSIKIENTATTGHPTFLSKLGSGANHMGFHLATLLGLHEYFLKLPETGKINYIPSFLVLDQPSQVYFPEGFPKDENEPVASDETQPGDNAASDTDAATDKKKNGAEEPKEAGSKKKAIPSEDISNTTAIFEACSQFLTRTNFKTQIIILEHASKSTWKGVENIYQAEEWRGNLETDKEHFDALIPLAWLES